MWVAFFSFPNETKASLYIEAGTSYGTMANGGSFFQNSAAQSSTSGFLGSLSLYVPVTKERNFFHFELGLQNRLLTAGNSLAMATNEIGARLQISRFYVGGGYSPLTYVSNSGVMSLHINPDTHAYFMEAGAIWRVIPEFQIVLTYSREYGVTSGGGQSPAPVAEYGLRFRFPLNPSDTSHGSAVDFDGFRYPFGFMK
jgi:hypothetical protein